MPGISGNWEDQNRDPLAGIKAILGAFTPEQWPGRSESAILPNAGGGMTPSPVNPEAITAFTNKVYPPGNLTGNVNQLPLNDFFNMLYNPNVSAAPNSAIVAPTAAPVGPVTSPVDASVANATKIAGQYGGGRLPWDFFMKNPTVSGGTLGLEGPEWAGKKSLTGATLQPGQTFTSFAPNKPPDMMDMIQPLIQQYAEKASALLSASPEQAAKMPFNMESLHNLIQGINSFIATQQAGAKVPSEIGKNLAEAGRPQVAQGWSGPGEMSTMLIPPGGQPSTIATGGPESKASLAGSTLFSKLIPTLAQEAMKASFDVTQTPEGRAEAQRVLTGLLGMAGTHDRSTQATTGKPSKDQWLASAKKANPGRSDQELLNYYQQKYGR